MRYGVVYRITNLETGKCYIGRTKNTLRDRWYDHCRRSSGCLYLKNAIEKYGKESFTITEIASSWDHENLQALEMLLIKQENTLVPNGYNLINTSNGAGEISEETRQKLSLIRKGKPSPMKGKKFSEEVRKNMGGQNKGKPMHPNTNQALRAVRLGQNLTEQHKQRISETRQLQVFSDNDRKKMSESQKGIHWYTDGENNYRYREESAPIHLRIGRVFHSRYKTCRA